MRILLQHRGLRLVFAAIFISMIGSGMSTTAVVWYLLQAAHSEVALGTLLILQTLPALVLLPFTGVFIDRADRRYLVMALDAAHGIFVVVVAILAFRGAAHLWEIYLMSTLLAAGSWLFWPSLNALIQELTPESRFAEANSLLAIAFHSGWLVAGAIVGVTYNHFGLSGVLFFDAATYALSIACYFFVRRGRHTVAIASPANHAGHITRFLREFREGAAYVRQHPRVLLMGSCWALFMAGMLLQGVIAAPLNYRILKAGAVGFGWLNSGWGIGACACALCTPALIRILSRRGAIGLATGLTGVSLILMPFLCAHLYGTVRLTASVTLSVALLAAMTVYGLIGSCRALGNVAIVSSMMEQVPKHFMGRVQNTFFFARSCLQLTFSLLVGMVAHRRSLAAAFTIVGVVYLLSGVAGIWQVKASSGPIHDGSLEQPGMGPASL